MSITNTFDPEKAPLAATFYFALNSHRETIKELSAGAAQQLPQPLNETQRLTILEAEVDALWHVMDAVFEAIHTLETGAAPDVVIGQPE